jgi:hypothetical protein
MIWDKNGKNGAAENVIIIILCHKVCSQISNFFRERHVIIDHCDLSSVLPEFHEGTPSEMYEALLHVTG